MLCARLSSSTQMGPLEPWLGHQAFTKRLQNVAMRIDTTVLQHAKDTNLFLIHILGCGYVCAVNFTDVLSNDYPYMQYTACIAVHTIRCLHLAIADR